MRRPGSIGQYLSGLGAAGLGLCAAGWLVLTPFGFGYQGTGSHAASHDAALTDWATGGGLAVICMITLVSWAVAWRRALLADGVLTRSPRRRARDRRRRERHGGGASTAPDPAQVLTALRALLAPLLDPAVVPGPRSAPESGPDGIAVIKSMLAGAELPMTGFDEEEAW
jgi:hypothetical protein